MSTLIRAVKKPFVIVGTSNADYIVDGVADDVQFQAAVDANTGMLFVKKATYNLATAVLLDSNTTIICEPGTLFVTSSSDHNAFKTTLTGTTKTVYENIHLENVKVESHKGSCIVLNNTTGVRLKNCEVYFSGTTTIRQGIFLQHCQDIWVNDPYAHDLTGNGISFSDCDTFICDNPIIDGGTNSDDGIDVDFDFLDTSTLKSNNGILNNVVVKSVGRGNGVRIENSDNIVLNGLDATGVTSTNGAGLCINVTGTNTMKNVQASAINVYSCTDRGVHIEKTSGATMEDIILSNVNVEDCGVDGGSNIRGGIVLAGPNISLSNFRIRNTAKTGGDGAALLFYQQNNISVDQGNIEDSVSGVRFWNGDGAQSYSGLKVKNMRFANNTNNYVNLSVANGDIEREETVLTTNNTVTTIATIPIPATTTTGIYGYVTARRTGGSAGTAEDGALYKIEAVYKNVAGTSTSIGSTVTVIGESQAGWDVTLNPTGATVLVQVTGATNNNISWSSSLKTQQINS